MQTPFAPDVQYVFGVSAGTGWVNSARKAVAAMPNVSFICAFYITERGEPQGWLEINQLRSRLASSEQQVSKDGLRPESAYAASQVQLLILATRFLSDGISALGQNRTLRDV
jgi:hypothetical protein